MLSNENLTYLILKYKISLYQPDNDDLIYITSHRIPLSFFWETRIGFSQKITLYTNYTYLNSITFKAANDFFTRLEGWDEMKVLDEQL